MAEGTRRSVVLRHRPSGAPRPHDFEIVEGELPDPGPGEVLTRTIWLSIDPYMRGRLSDRPSYAAPVQIGEVMTGESIGEVIASLRSPLRARRRCARQPRLADAFGEQG